MAAWIKPKLSHKQMVNRLLQVRAHLILCFRAEPKVEMVKGSDGRWEIREKRTLTGLEGWVPVCEKNLPFELTTSLLLLPDKPGVPRPIKLQEQHKALFPLDRPITEASGRDLAAWAKGGGLATPAVSTPSAAPEAGVDALVEDWLTVIGDAQTRDDLRDLQKRLKAAADTLPAAALATLRAAYSARQKTLTAETPV